MRRYAPGHVAVVGGGLAGIAAALQLVDAGHRVTVFESRPDSASDLEPSRASGRHFDNGQHVFLRCCDAYRELVEQPACTEAGDAAAGRRGRCWHRAAESAICAGRA